MKSERVVRDRRRGSYIERAKPGYPGVVEREWISGGYTIRGGGELTVVEGGLASRRKPVGVLVTAEAREEILHRAFWETRMDGCETGEGLFGINARSQVLITRANGPGALAKRRPSSVVFDSSAFEHWDPRDDSIMRVGDWHTHPGRGSGRPSDYGSSDGDVCAWQASLERLSRDVWVPYYVGLIVTGERDSGRSVIHAWTLDHARKLERATITALGKD
jgi:hypothetical protein